MSELAGMVAGRCESGCERDGGNPLLVVEAVPECVGGERGVVVKVK